MDTPAFLILSVDADDFAAQLSVGPHIACYTADQARNAYTNESILIGDPHLVAEVLPEMPTIKWVQSTWAGVKPLIELDRRNYVLTGVKGVFGTQMTEYVMGYLLTHELNTFERRKRQRDRKWYDAHSDTLHGKRLGIMGTGSIGEHIARTATAFGMHVCGLNRSGDAVNGFEEVFGQDRLHEFLAGLDYLVSVLPQTPETDGLLDTGALAHLADHVYFINIGRGNVVDDQALMDALAEKRLAGAALDVFNEEPLPDSSPLWTTPNLTITAHIAAQSYPALIAPLFAENYKRYVAGQPLNCVIDFEAGY